MKDILARSETRNLMAITCWYCGMAFFALLQASTTENLRQDAEADLDILKLAVKQLKLMWGTAKVIEKGFERLRATARSSQTGNFLSTMTGSETLEGNLGPDSSDPHDGIEWMDYFPFVTAETSSIANTLLTKQNTQSFPFDNFFDPSLLHFQDIFEGLDLWNDTNNIF